MPNLVFVREISSGILAQTFLPCQNTLLIIKKNEAHHSTHIQVHPIPASNVLLKGLHPCIIFSNDVRLDPQSKMETDPLAWSARKLEQVGNSRM